MYIYYDSALNNDSVITRLKGLHLPRLNTIQHHLH